jgi:hypothetical protein
MRSPVRWRQRLGVIDEPLHFLKHLIGDARVQHADFEDANVLACLVARFATIQ